MSPQTTPKRPYLIRAMHEWMTDNGLTPHIVVDASAKDVAVPKQYVSDGRILLNVSYAATRDLVMDNRSVQFEARFSGVNHRVQVPAAAVIGIYARETGQGMIFSEEESPESGPKKPHAGEAAGRPTLKVVK